MKKAVAISVHRRTINCKLAIGRVDYERREGRLTSNLDIARLSHPMHLSSEGDEGRGMGRMGGRRGGGCR